MQHCRRALDVEVPMLVGRRAATAQVRSEVTQAYELLGQARDEFVAAGSALDDARAEVDSVLPYLRGTNRSRLQRCVIALQHPATVARGVAQAETAAARGELLPWVDTAMERLISLGKGDDLPATAGATAGVRDTLRIVGTEHADELGATGLLARIVGSRTPRDAASRDAFMWASEGSRFAAARRGSDAGRPADPFQFAWKSVLKLGDFSREAGEANPTMSAARLRTWFDAITERAGTPGEQPRWLATAAPDLEIDVSRARAEELWMRSTMRSHEDVAEYLLERIGVSSTTLSMTQHRVAAFDVAAQLPSHLRYELPVAARDKLATLPRHPGRSLQPDAYAQLDEIYREIAAENPARLRREAERLLGGPLTTDQPRRLTMLASVDRDVVIEEIVARARDGRPNVRLGSLEPALAAEVRARRGEVTTSRPQLLVSALELRHDWEAWDRFHEVVREAGVKLPDLPPRSSMEAAGTILDQMVARSPGEQRAMSMLRPLIDGYEATRTRNDLGFADLADLGRARSLASLLASMDELERGRSARSSSETLTW